MDRTEKFVEHVDVARAEQFVHQCQMGGFTANQTAVLATINAWASRSNLSNAMANNRTFRLALMVNLHSWLIV